MFCMTRKTGKHGNRCEAKTCNPYAAFYLGKSPKPNDKILKLNEIGENILFLNLAECVYFLRGWG